MENPGEILNMIKNELKSEYSETSYDLWLRDLKLQSLNESTMTIIVDTEFKYGILKKKFGEIIEKKAAEILGFPITVEFVLIENPEYLKYKRTPFDDDDSQKKLGDIKSGTDNFYYHGEYTFDNYIVGGSNKFAHAACVAVAGNPGSVYNPLFIYGPSGLGKTHLMYAVANEIMKKNPNTNLIYIKCEDFTNQLIEAISQKNTPAFREKYRRADVLLIDDVQFLADKEATQEELFHTFNALYEDHRQLILTSDRPAKDIRPLEDRLKTRFEWGLIADIQPPDMELRCAIIKKKANDLGIMLPNDVILCCAEKLKNNIRQLEGSIKRIRAMSIITGDPITLELANKCLSDVVSDELPDEVKVSKILSAVADKYGIDTDDITGKKRNREIAWARHTAIYIIRQKTSLSQPMIGKVFDRDHSTIVSSLKLIENEINDNPSFAVEINELMNEIDI